MPRDVAKGRTIDLTLIVLAAIWGSSYLAAKSLLGVFSVAGLLSFRFALTTLALVLLWLTRRRPVQRRELQIALGLGLIQAVVFTVETLGVSRTSAANAGLIISITIIFTPIVESLAKRSWLPVPFFVATATALLGIGLLVTSQGLHRPSLGDLLMLTAAVVRSVHVTWMGRLTKGHDYDSLFLTMVQCALCFVLFSVVGGANALHQAGHLHPSQWFAGCFLGVVCSAVGFVVLLWSVRLTSASRVSLLLGTEPLWAVVVALVVGHEAIGLVGVIGGIVIIASTYAAQGIEQRHRLATH